MESNLKGGDTDKYDLLINNQSEFFLLRCNSCNFCGSKKLFSLILGFLIISVFTPQSSATMANLELAEVSKGNNLFANKFYKAVAKQEGNVFFSPLSAHMILSLVYQGAAGDTEKGFMSALEVSDKKLSAKGHNGVISTLNGIKDVTLHIANKVFVMEQNFTLHDEFSKAAKELFLSEAEFVDFAKNVEAAGNINGWVEKKTNSKIKDLISPNDLNALTRLVLVNAIYFKGNWADQFRKEATRTEPFFITSQNKVDCQMMHIKKKYNYSQNESLGAKILEMPYSNKNVSMVIILPDDTDGIKALEAKLMDVDLSTLTNNMRYVEVEVSLPKFKIETSMDLQPILTEMGLGMIFDARKADFSGMSETPLYVSKAIQKAFIEVNEEGAEAAAATAALMMFGCSMASPIQENIFKADHPFILLLQSKQDLSITTLFYGRISTPDN